MNKYRYAKDYVSDSKETGYTGDYYEFKISDEAYKKMRRIIPSAIITITFLFVAVGFLNNGGSRCFYVLLPYVCILYPLTVLIRSYLRIPRKPRPMEYIIFDKCYTRMKFALVGLILTSIITSIGDCIFIFRNAHEISLIKEGIFCISSIAITVIAILLLRYHNQIVCEKQS